MASRATAAVRRFLLRRLDLQRTGGVLFTRDDSTLILADVSVFSSAHAQLLEAAFPHVSFAVVACETSASGFIVVFSCAADDGVCRRSALRLILHLFFFVACAALAVQAPPARA
jgi:hypothetical protein